MIFIAEWGDKTQLVALSMATRYRGRVVLAGILTATLLVHVLSVLIGGCAGRYLPQNWVLFLAGLAFVGFGLWTLRGDDGSDEAKPRFSSSCPFLLVTLTFFLAEPGDKTMLGTCTLAARYPLWPVWLGSTTGMVISDGLAIVVGRMIGAKVAAKPVRIAAAIIFFVFGILGAVQGGVTLHPPVWGTAVVVLAGIAYILFRKPRTAAQSVGN